MRVTLALLALVTGLVVVPASALAVRAPAVHVPTATISIVNVSGASYELDHGTGWAWAAPGGPGCTVTASVVETPFAPPSIPVPATITNSVSASTMVNHNPVKLKLTDPARASTIDSASAISATCHMRRDYVITTTTSSNVVAARPGGDRTYRTQEALAPGGKCTWMGDGSHGALSTCTHASISIKYKFFLPAGATFVGASHTMAPASRPCLGSSWQLSHIGTTYSYVLHHGSAASISQCDIRSVSFTWHGKHTTTSTGWMTTTAAAIWP